MRRPSRDEILNQYRVFNADFFQGKLPEVPVHWRRMAAYGTYCEPDARHPFGYIELTVDDMPPGGWRGTLLHEMVHLRLDSRGVDEFETGEVPDHGPRFTAECNRIGKLLGIPAYCDASSWYWPHAHMDFGLDDPEESE